ncbi:signal peptidase I [Enterococcus moraviensis]|nr:signal peptidase I [Enterococcus haemoperoxidus]OJG66969.1 signal peptidase I [Enterococcus moraviensis]
MTVRRVDGQSMDPNLANSDRVLVFKDSQPKRYNIITFRPKGKPNESYVKRVIGIPGDAIWMDNNTLYINHQLVSETERPLTNSNLLGRKLPDGTIKVWLNQKLIKEFAGKQMIPENKYFVLGDNRNHSSDSRVFGLVDTSQIEGVVKWRYYPFNKIGTID